MMAMYLPKFDVIKLYLKLTNHMSTEVPPLLFLSSCHEALVKLVGERQFGCDWACLCLSPRELGMLINKAALFFSTIVTVITVRELNV